MIAPIIGALQAQPLHDHQTDGATPSLRVPLFDRADSFGQQGMPGKSISSPCGLA